MTEDDKRKASEIRAYIEKGPGPWSSWYAGVAEDARDRLFNGHSVDKDKGKWSYRTFSSDDVARQVEQDLFAKGCDGGPGGGSEDSKMVYAYHKEAGTKP